jgi:hypothetical protein
LVSFDGKKIGAIIHFLDKICISEQDGKLRNEREIGKCLVGFAIRLKPVQMAEGTSQ